jgi:hypothetical protein
VVERVSFGHPKLEPNRLFWGDNLHVMRQLPSESIDLIYIDPPFFSGRWHHFRRETRCRDYSAITRAACSVMEVMILLSGSAVNPESGGFRVRRNSSHGPCAFRRQQALVNHGAATAQDGVAVNGLARIRLGLMQRDDAQAMATAPKPLPVDDYLKTRADRLARGEAV